MIGLIERIYGFTQTNTETAMTLESAVSALASRVSGRILSRGDRGFDDACMIYNSFAKRIPRAILQCASVGDVIEGVSFARRRDLVVAIRGGGHNVAGHALCDGGLVIDFSRMREVQVDPEARRARCQPGATWGEFDRATQVYGLATPGGIISTTGVAGLTLGGGIGILRGLYGLTCDNLSSATLVTADGELITASATENPELFWGIRGGGGNFGIVVSFEFQLHPVGPVVSGTLEYPIEQASEVIQRYREFTRGVPPQVASDVLLRNKQGVDQIAVIMRYIGPAEEAEKALKPMREFGRAADFVVPTTYCQSQSQLEAGSVWGRRHYWKSTALSQLSDSAIKTIVEYFKCAPSRLRMVMLEHFHGAMTGVDPDATPINFRGAAYNTMLAAQWLDPREDEENIRWVKEFRVAMDPYSDGTAYLNYFAVEPEELIRAAYGERKYQRLVALKDKYDPLNFFRMNQNIKPSLV